MSSANTGEDLQDEGRSADDVKLIASLKNKIKVLKKAYTEEHEKSVSYMQQLDDLVPKTKRLRETLAEKEALIANLNEEISNLQDKYTSSPRKGNSSPNKIKNIPELEQANEDLKKENDELKNKLGNIRENLAVSEKLLTELKDEYTTKMITMTKKVDSSNEQVEASEKERKELKESCEKYENQIKILFEQKA